MNEKNTEKKVKSTRPYEYEVTIFVHFLNVMQ